MRIFPGYRIKSGWTSFPERITDTQTGERTENTFLAIALRREETPFSWVQGGDRQAWIKWMGACGRLLRNPLRLSDRGARGIRAARWYDFTILVDCDSSHREG